MKRISIISLTILTFCFVFSFKVVGPFNSSMLIGVIFFILSIKKRVLLSILGKIFSLPYSVKLLKYSYVLFFLSISIPVLYQTFDFYFSQIILVLFIQFSLGCCLWAIFIFVDRYIGGVDVEKIIVHAFLIQSIIQCIVSSVPSLQPTIFYFNGAESINESYNLLFGVGVRGVALASGTGFSLSLGYGIAFIIYVRKYIVKKLSFYNIAIGVVLFVGIFFAGRTGFVGVIIGFVYYCIDREAGSFLKKLENLFKALLYCSFFCFAIYLVFYDFVNHLIDNVFPFAFEPLYNLFNNDSFETSSTNSLQEMWEVPIEWNEFVMGAGYYFDPQHPSTFYKQVDIGLFKNIFFWGILGYFLILIYQYIQIYPLSRKSQRRDFYYYGAIFLFLFLLDLKAIALGLNKTAFSILLLISFYYEKNSLNNSICAK